MTDINRALYTAREAIMSNLMAINITGSNIANVNTPGYSRLKPVFESVGSKDPSSNISQSGVRIADVQRMYDKFLVSQLAQQNSAVGNFQAQSDLFKRIEGVLNESAGGGINDALDKFWNAWGDVSSNPSGKAQRDVLISAAENLSSTFRQRVSDLSDIQIGANQTISDTITTLNGYIRDIANYNAEIVSTEVAGGKAPDLRDKRDEALRNLSNILDVNYIEKDDGSLYVSLATDGKALVEESNTWLLETRNNVNTGLYDIAFTNDSTNTINDSISGGKLAGLLTIRDTTIPAYIDELNQTASSIINKVNEQHALGYDQDGNVGGAFFTPTAEAKYMEVSAAIVADARKIAASSTVNSDGDNAKAMYTLKDDPIYASVGTIKDATPAATASITVPGPLTVDGTILLTRGATAANWTVTTHTGYGGMVIKSADANTVTIDADGDGTAEISLALSGTWESGDTAAFTITAAAVGPPVVSLALSAVTATDADSGVLQNHSVTGEINNVGQVYKNTTADHPISLIRGATADTWDISDNGGYSGAVVLSSSDSKVTLDLDGNGSADITLNLSGTWQQNDTLSFALTKNDSTTTIGGYYDAFISRVGQDVSASSLTLDRQTAILNQFNDQREQISGVSLDEEMMNLIKFQMGYNAAGRLTSTVSEMMDVLINLGK